MFEKSKWISKIVKNWDLSYLFRKEFNIEKSVKYAELNICMLGLGVCTINGQNVADEVLSTPVSRYDRRTYYNTYDVTELLNNKRNAIGIHLGNGWYNDNGGIWETRGATWRGMPKILVEFNITYEDGEVFRIVTDKSWKTHEGGCIYNHTRQGEIFDFNIAQKGYDLVGFDDSHWSVPIITAEPGGVLEKKDMPPIRVIRTIEPISIKNNIYDFGENISGRVRVVATGKKGHQMSIKYDEMLNNDGSDLLGYIDNFAKREGFEIHHKNIITFSGEENEEYAPDFGYYGFRYVKIENAPENIKVVAEVMHTDLEKTATFKCSDEMLNKIHEASVRSTITNYHGIPTDCPHREQNGWTGDAAISCDQASINFDMYKVYQKWMTDIRDVQRLSGQIPAIVPTPNYWGFSSGPTWDCALFVIPWRMYEVTGDKTILEDNYDIMEKYLDYLERTNENFVIEFGLGDWCHPKEQVKECPDEILFMGYYYLCAKTMAKIAETIDKPNEKWIELADNIKVSWRSLYLDNTELYNSQTYLAAAIYLGLLTNEEEKMYADRLAQAVKANGYHTDCGILGQKAIFSALSDFGYIDVAYKMTINPAMPSYAYWINIGMTTLCEKWEEAASRNHHMFSEVDHWFYKYLGGLNFDKGEITVNPVYLEDVADVNVKYKNLTVQRSGKTVTVSTKEKVYVMINGKKKELENGSLTYELR